MLEYMSVSYNRPIPTLGVYYHQGQCHRKKVEPRDDLRLWY